MFLKSLLRKKERIGIEITSNLLNIAQLRQQGQSYYLQAFTSINLPQGVVQDGKIQRPDQLAELIKSALMTNKIKAKQVAATILGQTVTQVIAIPAEMNDEDLRDMVLNQEASLYLPFPREQADIDYQKLHLFIDHDGIEKTKVLLVAVQKEITNSYLETFHQAGLEVNTLETTSCALTRTLKGQLQKLTFEEAIAILDIEFDCTEISIVVGGVPQFSRTLSIGAYHLVAALSRAMYLPPSRSMNTLQDITIPLDWQNTTSPAISALLRVLDNLTDDIISSIDSFLRQEPELRLLQLLLSGAGCVLNQLDDYLSMRLNLPIKFIDPVRNVGLITNEDIPLQRRVRMGAVVGLCLK